MTKKAYLCGLMKSSSLTFLVFALAVLISASSCKSEFEQIRISNDPVKQLKNAYKYYDDMDYYKAKTLFELTINSFRGKPELEKLYYTLSMSHYNLKEYILAQQLFTNFAQTFTYSELREEAEYMAAFSQYKLSPIAKLDQTYTLKAIDAFQTFVDKYPLSVRVVECNGLIDEMRMKLEEKAIGEGMLYFNLKEYQAAITSLENVLLLYPDTDEAEKIRYTILKSSYLFASNSVYDKRKERYMVVREKHTDFINKFPNSKYKSEVIDILNTSNKEIKLFQNAEYKNKSTGTRS